jgi:hypothetical protein
MLRRSIFNIVSRARVNTHVWVSMWAKRTGIVEMESFAQTYKSYGLATVRYSVLKVTATVEPFENGRGFSLRVLRAGKPRTNPTPNSYLEPSLAEIRYPSPNHPSAACK